MQNRILDLSSSFTIAVTFVLFVIALWTKGLTHDLLLEAGVFLVSVKLVITSYRSTRAMEEVSAELERIRQALEHRKDAA